MNLGAEMTDTKNSILDGLNAAQIKATTQEGKPLLVLAGAGSGKTRVLTRRIAHMVQKGVNPASILAVTFTNKAAKEMRARVTSLIGEDQVKHLWIGTFHAICVRILRMDIDKIHLGETAQKKWTRNFVIFDETDSVNVVKEAIKILDLDPKLYIPKSIKARISSAKNEGKTSAEFIETRENNNYREEKIGLIFDKYEELMIRNNALDFDDLLLHTVKLLQSNKEVLEYYSNRFRQILVDEYQDTNHTQYELVRLLAEGCLVEDRAAKFDKPGHWQNQTLTVVGDVDQSIYSWRGADFRIIVNFQNDYPESDVVKLEENYRSSASILAVADAIITNNEERLEKNLIATRGEGEKVTVFEAQDEVEEAQFMAEEIQRRMAQGKSLKDFAILYRTNVQSRAIEEAFLKRNLPYTIVGGFKFYERKEVKDMLAYLKMIYNPSDSVSLKRVINEPRRGIGATTVTKVEEYANKNGFTVYKTMMEIDDVPGLTMGTKNKIKDFVDLIEELRLAEKSLELGDLVELLVEKTGYMDMLTKSSDVEAESRVENLHELIGVASDFEVNGEIVVGEDEQVSVVGSFLAELTLMGEQDKTKGSGNAISMMSLHAAKGLEFPIVFIGGLEEGVLPHRRSMDSRDPSQLEEERRLMYVGVTRAEEKLFLTYARRRRIFGQSEFAVPSRFFEEAPKDMLVGYYGQSGSNERGSRFDNGYSRDEIVDDIDGGGWNRTSFSKPEKKKQWSQNAYGDGYAPPNETPQKGYSSEVVYDEFDDGAVLRRKPQTEGPVDNPKASSPKARWSAESSGIKEEKNIFEIGSRVKHSRFGEGEVKQVLGSGNKALYNIEFAEAGLTKLLDPKFAKLVKIS